MRLLVTGVSGLLGLNLAYQAAGRFQVTGVLHSGGAQATPTTPFETLTADLTQPGQVDRILEVARPDLIVHCAALTDVDRCEMYPEEAFRVNAFLPQLLSCAARRNGVRMLHISTDAVFDGLRGDYSEADEPNPLNIYAHSKLEGEHAVADSNPDALIARVNFYGWSWQGRRSLSEFFFNNLSAGVRVSGFADLFFCPLLVNDLVEILLSMLSRGLNGIYHVVSSEYQSKYAFARMLARQFHFDENLVSQGSFRTGRLRALRSPMLTLRTDKLVSVLGEVLPGQELSMRRYYALYTQGYPQTLRSLLVHSGHTNAE